MTFKEINNLELSNDLKDLIKSIYYKEYMKEIDDNNETRKKFIEDIKKIIK
jgi:predicted AlkP superfamily phosphohydrolase/phosphomutase